MPRRDNGWKQMEHLTLAERRIQPDHSQERWYRWILPRVLEQSVLDVGAGTGYGIQILREKASLVSGIDLLPAGPEVENRKIEEVLSKSWDWCVAADVVEHVEDDACFLENMIRVAKRGVFFCTPNWNHWHAQNVFHVREYTPAELKEFLKGTNHEIWTENYGDVPERNDTVQDDCGKMHFGVIINL